MTFTQYAKYRVADTLRSWLSNWPASEWPHVFGYGRQTSTGVSVSEYTALNYSAVWAAVSLVAGDIASLPLILYKRTPNGGKERHTDSKLYELMHDAPNPEMTSMVFREALQAHVMTWGGGYAEIERDALGRPSALWPITPDRVTPFRDGRELRYRVTNGSGGQVVLLPRNVLHVPGLGYDGVVGYSVISQARESISLGLATERFGGEFFGNGTTFGGVLTTDKPLTTEVKQGIRESIDALHTGVDRAHRFGIFGHGFKFEKTGIPPNDAQFLETRKFQVTEIARWFQIPPHKLGDLERATFSNIEQQDIEYYRSCLRRWLVRWEQELNRKLIPPLERRQQFFKHNAEGILRGDSAARSTFYREMFNIGAYSINMILESEDLNPIGPEGDVHFVQGNLMPADVAMDGPQKPLPEVTVEKVPQKALAAGEDDEENERAVAIAMLGAISAKTEAIEASITAQRDALSQAEHERHAEAIAKLTEERAQLQQQFDAYRDAQAQAVAELHVTLTAAQQETHEERIAREAAEAAQAAATASTDEARAAAAAAELRAAEEAAARAAAEARATSELAAQRAATEAELTGRREAEAAAAAAIAAKASEVEQLASRVTELDTARTAAEAQLAEAIRKVADSETRIAQLADESRGLTTETAAIRQAREQAEREGAEAKAQIVAAQEKISELETAIRSRKDAELDRLTRVITAHRALIVDVVKRLMVPELDRARRRQSTPDNLRKWVDAFYVTHPDVCAEALYPVVLTHLAWKGADVDARQAARTLASEHCEESKRQLLAVVDGSTPEGFHADLERLLIRWEQERPDTLADKVLTDEVAHIRSLS